MTNRAVKAISWAVAYGAIAFFVSYLLGGEPGWIFFIGSLIAGFIVYDVLGPDAQNKRRKKQQQAGEI
ncbi:DUF2061 domain-containing protein [Planococcus sp. CP5-4]|uniref:DUF2061 domain-containing protein n=1 Tax=unclassified Planococcus (in: firmicutes) TaxID=2662419 RepID=UPI001C222267|nr:MULTISPECIES: DUF2061 domain-containing protein [unclassified Planococcus (in: firmicutes)]MBU9674009.1 DUF2061 domain-containing protein [Planococcus sp. CP5-4_YE]MBV0909880.1 DUF2061 domain-containing protein [Planococcus sp. CP5-4_UN]MBW6064760.1 DUF2061 domain-containing protein [Planococcus sp. CP5-4]